MRSATSWSKLREIDERWQDLPLRTRLTTGASVAATAVIIAVIAVAYLTVRHELRGNIDSQLRHQANELAVQKEFGPVGPYTDVRSGVGDIGGVRPLPPPPGPALPPPRAAGTPPGSPPGPAEATRTGAPATPRAVSHLRPAPLPPP